MLRLIDTFFAEGNGRVFKVYRIEQLHRMQDGRDIVVAPPSLISREGFDLVPNPTDDADFVPRLNLMVRKLDTVASAVTRCAGLGLEGSRLRKETNAKAVEVPKTVHWHGGLKSEPIVQSRRPRATGTTMRRRRRGAVHRRTNR
jgi:hypothetical protein